VNDDRELFSEIVQLIDGTDAVQAIAALVNVLAFAIAQAAAPGRVEPLLQDAIRGLERGVRKTLSPAPCRSSC
jgi:hypothetical protein